MTSSCYRHQWQAVTSNPAVTVSTWKITVISSEARGTEFNYVNVPSYHVVVCDEHFEKRGPDLLAAHGHRRADMYSISFNCCIVEVNGSEWSSGLVHWEGDEEKSVRIACSSNYPEYQLSNHSPSCSGDNPQYEMFWWQSTVQVVPATIHSTNCLTTVQVVSVTITEREVPMTIHSSRCSGDTPQYEMFRRQTTVRDVPVTTQGTRCSGENTQYDLFRWQSTVQNIPMTIHSTRCSGDNHRTRCSGDTSQYEMFQLQFTVRDVPVTIQSTRCSGDNPQYEMFRWQSTVRDVPVTIHLVESLRLHSTVLLRQLKTVRTFSHAPEQGTVTA
jgi:hypothetical protein